VREALAGLTTRGRSFLAAGGAAGLLAVALGERDLLRVAALLVGLPLLSAAVVARTRYRLSCSRRLDPVRVAAGRAAQVVLRLENVSRLPTGLLLVEDGLPYQLGRRPRFVLDRLGASEAREVSYPVRADARGRYPVGPLTVRLADPFGMVELTRAFQSVDQLTVTPPVTPLPPVRLGGEWVGGGESPTRAVAAHGEDDAATREYRQGDDLRKVHWRSTARVGELMVRREEQPWRSRAVVLLDTRVTAHRGEGPGSSFEWAVGAAASVATHLGHAGYGLRLVTAAGTPFSAGVSADQQGLVLDHLADVRPGRQPHLGAAVAPLTDGGEGLGVAVLGLLQPDDVALLARARARVGTGVVILVDVTSWLGLSARLRGQAYEELEEGASRLRAAGWRVLVAGRGASLADLWPAAGARADRLAVAGRGGPAGRDGDRAAHRWSP